MGQMPSSPSLALGLTMLWVPAQGALSHLQCFTGFLCSNIYTSQQRLSGRAPCLHSRQGRNPPAGMTKQQERVWSKIAQAQPCSH